MVVKMGQARKGLVILGLIFGLYIPLFQLSLMIVARHSQTDCGDEDSRHRLMLEAKNAFRSKEHSTKKHSSLSWTSSPPKVIPSTRVIASNNDGRNTTSIMLGFRELCEKSYRMQYPDVDSGIQRGFLQSGFDYWRVKGSAVGRQYPCIPSYITSETCARDYRADFRSVADVLDIPTEKSCKLLWFSALYEGISLKFVSSDGRMENRYINDYMVALASASLHANQTLQPILIIGRYKLPNENSTELSSFGKWAESHGAIVYHVGKLSFQSDLDAGWKRTQDGRGDFQPSMMGTFLRFEIPQIIKDLKLFDLPGVCDRHALYTDPDVVFVNNITDSDIAHLRNGLLSDDDHVIMYGPEANFHFPFSNVGVFLMDVLKFKDMWEKMRIFASKRLLYPNEDQDMINSFINETNSTHTRKYLPAIWNWKLYWSIDPYRWDDIKVIHTHGPKLGTGVENMAVMNPDLPYHDGEVHRHTYDRFVRAAIACNGGESAARYADLYYSLLPIEDLSLKTEIERSKVDSNENNSVWNAVAPTCRFIYHISVPCTKGSAVQETLSKLLNYNDLSGDNFYMTKGINIIKAFETMNQTKKQIVVSSEIGISDLIKVGYQYFNDTCFFAVLEEPSIWIVAAETNMRLGANYKDGYIGTWGYFDEANIQSNMVGFGMDLSSLNHKTICVYTPSSVSQVLDSIYATIPKGLSDGINDQNEDPDKWQYSDVVAKKYGKDVELLRTVKAAKGSSICW